MRRWADRLGMEFMRRASGLTLARPQYTDEVIPLISQLKDVESNGLSETQITSEGVARLRWALPNCEIHWNGR